jgi:hypothetical protein
VVVVVIAMEVAFNFSRILDYVLILLLNETESLSHLVQSKPLRPDEIKIETKKLVAEQSREDKLREWLPSLVQLQ